MTPHVDVCPEHNLVIDGLEECPLCADTNSPEEWDDPTLEDALDGIYTAVRYCEDNGHGALATRLREGYQLLGEIAGDEDV